jgi:hypothetical protein
MAIDYSTDVGRVRLLIPDTDVDNLLLIDPQIDALLSMEGSVLSTDGTKVAAELRARAAALRQQVDDGVGDDDVGLAIVDFDPRLGYRGYTPC